MPFVHETLDNGLHVVAETSGAARSVSLGFFVRTGARDERDEHAGVSHFLEHMVFKGTSELSADDINAGFDRMGAAANAFTSEEDTVYYASVLPGRQEEALGLLARMMRPALRAEDFTTEKLVILEEIRMYDDQPPFGADERCRAAFFGRHPLARSVLGTVETVGGLDVEAMRDYHRRRYAPGSMVLAAAGAVDVPGLVAAARRLCGAWESQLDEPPVPAAAPRGPAGGAALERIVRPQAALEYAVRMTAGPAESHPDRFAAKLLATVLGDGSGSRLYWELVDPGLAEQATLHHHDFLDAGLFVTQLSCAAEDVDELLARIAAAYAGAAAGVERGEFERARNKLASRVVLAGESPRRRLFEVGGEWSHTRAYRSVADSLQIVESLGRDDLDRVQAEWPLTAPAATVLAGPA